MVMLSVVGKASTIVEAMRHGMSPKEACLHALERIVETTTEKRLLRDDGRPNFDVKFYAVSIDGRYAGAAIWSGAKFAVHDSGRNRREHTNGQDRLRTAQETGCRGRRAGTGPARWADTR